MRSYIRKFCQLCERYPLTAFMGVMGFCMLCACYGTMILREERSKHNSQQTKNIAKVLIANTAIYKENETLFRRIRKNSDTIMRYSHYMNQHNPDVKRVPFCPECGEGASEELVKNTITDHEEVTEEVPETFKQLLKDSEELRNSVSSASSSMFGQSIALEAHLDKLRTTKPRQ